MKAAGFEPVDLRSGYDDNSLGRVHGTARQPRDVFHPAVACGKHSVALPPAGGNPRSIKRFAGGRGAMYAPELQANSDEIKLKISD